MRLERILMGALLAGSLLAPGIAVAASFAYISQTGSVSAHNCENVSQAISGLGNADVLAIVDVGVGGCAASTDFAAMSEMRTTLGPGGFGIEQQIIAKGLYSSGGPDPFGASGNADLTILFTLDEDARLRLAWEIDPPDTISWQDQPHFWLANSSEGWSVGLLGNEPGLWECAGPDETCLYLFDVFSDEGLLIPAGTYEFGLTAHAFTPTGSCSRGCNNMGSNITLSIVPEPGTASLLLGGFALLAGARRRH